MPYNIGYTALFWKL